MLFSLILTSFATIDFSDDLWASVGSVLATMLKPTSTEVVSMVVGLADGAKLGVDTDEAVGKPLGTGTDIVEGLGTDINDGIGTGTEVGDGTGTTVGTGYGTDVGDVFGSCDGDGTGRTLGRTVGAPVGAGVGSGMD